jgi:hypothetical protein
MEFRILGPIEVIDRGRKVAIRRGKEQAVLAYLLLHDNEVVASDRLVDELWGERAPATAVKILQNAVSQLRKALGDDRLITRSPCYVLRVEPGELDLERFESLAERGRTSGDPRLLRHALDLWRGEPFAELRDEPFAREASRRLEEAQAQRTAGPFRRRARPRAWRRPRAAARAPAARSSFRRAPVPTADARALSSRAAAGCPRDLPACAKALRHRARSPAGPRARGAAAADPQPGSRACAGPAPARSVAGGVASPTLDRARRGGVRRRGSRDTCLRPDELGQRLSCSWSATHS